MMKLKYFALAVGLALGIVASARGRIKTQHRRHLGR